MRQGLLYGKLTLTAVFWGGTFVAGRIIAREVPPFSAAFLRFVVASTALGFVLWRRHGGLPPVRRHHLLSVAALGLSGVFAYNAFFFAGLKTVSAGRASLIIANNPVMIALFSALVFRERLGPVRLLGIAVALCGAVLVITHGHPGAVWAGAWGRGELLILGCVASWTTYSLVSKAAPRDLLPMALVTYACAVGALFLLPGALTEGVLREWPRYPGAAWAGVAYLGLCGSALAFVWYHQGVVQLGPARAGVFINLVPVSAVALAYVILGEGLDRSVWLGAVLVLVGVILTNRASGLEGRKLPWLRTARVR